MQESEKESDRLNQEISDSDERRQRPPAVSKAAGLKRSLLTIKIDDLGQLKMSDSFISLLRETIPLTQEADNPEPSEHFVEEMLKFKADEVNEIICTVHLVTNPQKDSVTEQLIPIQVNSSPPTSAVRKLDFESEIELMGDRFEIGSEGIQDQVAFEQFKSQMAAKTEYSKDQREANNKELNATANKESELQRFALDHNRDLRLERNFNVAAKTIILARNSTEHDHVDSSSPPKQLTTSVSEQNSADDILKSANEAFSKGQFVVKVQRSKPPTERISSAVSFFKTARSQYQLLADNPHMSAIDKTKVDSRLKKLIDGKYSEAKLEETIYSVK